MRTDRYTQTDKTRKTETDRQVGQQSSKQAEQQQTNDPNAIFCSAWLGGGNSKHDFKFHEYGMVRYGAVRYATARYGTVWFGMVWYSTVRHGTVRYATARSQRILLNITTVDRTVATPLATFTFARHVPGG